MRDWPVPAALLRPGMTACALLIAGTPLPAQTLTEFLERVTLENPTVAKARAERTEKAAAVDVARAELRPGLSATVGVGPDLRQGPEAPLMMAGGVGRLTYPVADGGGRRAAVAANRHELLASDASVDVAAADVLLAGALAYLDALAVEAEARLRETAVAALSEELDLARARVTVGGLTRTDLAQVEARLRAAEARRAETEAARVRLGAELERIGGRAPTALAWPQLPDAVPGALAELDILVTEQPGIAKADAGIGAAAARVEIARAERRPTVDLDVALGMVGPGNLSRAPRGTSRLEVAMSTPLFDGGRAAAKTRAALANVDRARAERDKLLRETIERARAAAARFRAARDSVADLERAIVGAEAGLAGVRAEQRVGARRLVEVLNAVEELVDARLRAARGRRDMHAAAWRLLHATGRIVSRSELAVHHQQVGEAAVR